MAYPSDETPVNAPAQPSDTPAPAPAPDVPADGAPVPASTSDPPADATTPPADATHPAAAAAPPSNGSADTVSEVEDVGEAVVGDAIVAGADMIPIAGPVLHPLVAGIVADAEAALAQHHAAGGVGGTSALMVALTAAFNSLLQHLGEIKA